MKRVSTALSPKAHKILKAAATEDGRSLSNFISRILEGWAFRHQAGQELLAQLEADEEDDVVQLDADKIRRALNSKDDPSWD